MHLNRRSDARLICAACAIGILTFVGAAGFVDFVKTAEHEARVTASSQKPSLIVADQALEVENPKVQAEREWLLSLRKDAMLMLRESEKCYWKNSDCADDMDSGAAEYKAKWDEKHDYSDMRMWTHFIDMAHGAKVSQDDFEKEMKRIESLLDRIDERLGEIAK